MALEFSLTSKQQALRENLRGLAKHVIRPQSLAWDRAHGIPEQFLRTMATLNTSLTSSTKREETGPRETSGDFGMKNLDTLLVTEELAWGDAALPLCMPGPGLGGPPVRGSGTDAQKKRYLGIFEDMSESLKWGAYALTEPGAGSDVAGIRTSCRKDGASWVLDGRKCYITNGARASWNVVFATVDPSLGRAGHRAFVVERGTPGFSVGRIEEKMGLRASETAELVLEDCRVPEECLLGGEDSYASREGFMTAMKTFDNTRPIVAAMAIGIGRAAFEYARGFVREHYALARHVPRYSAIAERLARVGRDLEAARLVTWRAGWLADQGIANAKEASMAKALGGQAAIRACIEAIEICGVEGTLQKDHQLLEKWFRDIKVYDIFEGTGQIQRIVIAKRLLTNLKSF
ncbi:MAG TPA: acyl-CoA dehydrogenase family protein [Polyangiaceae bacterium]|jgi:acyl-CoA dehydrogenase|nr:acyl-CoA dehydrogenase family protein [Polyangiaceae bacterium]